MKRHVRFDLIGVKDRDKPFQSVYIEFVKRNGAEILECGEFEALRRWLYSRPDCFPVPIIPETSHKVTREFYKNLRKEQKNNITILN